MIFDPETVYDELHPYFQKRVQRHEPLARHAAFGVGGPADVWLSLESQEELLDLVRLCAQEHWPLLVVGNGTNILFADAGVSWPRLVHELAPLGWSGLEFGIGIPGTLGGGVISNAGAHNDELGRVLEWIEVLDARGCNAAGEDQIGVAVMRRYVRDELDLGYRHSRFREQRQVRFDERGQLIPAPRGMIEPAEIITRLLIHLHHEEPQQLRKTLAQYKHDRQMTEPTQRHAGSIFKDPPGHQASRLIDQAGMKGRVHGKAQIAERNPNYIVNVGGASAADVAALIMEAHQAVLQRCGVELELDVELHGEWEV